MRISTAICTNNHITHKNKFRNVYKSVCAFVFMVITDIGAVAEKVYDVELRELWHNPGYFLEVVAPGSRYESDFRVGVIIYRTATNAEGGLMLKCIGHVKVDERELRSLEIPGFFLKIGSRIREYLAGHNGINLK